VGHSFFPFPRSCYSAQDIFKGRLPSMSPSPPIDPFLSPFPAFLLTARGFSFPSPNFLASFFYEIPFYLLRFPRKESSSPRGETLLFISPFFFFLFFKVRSLVIPEARPYFPFLLSSEIVSSCRFSLVEV